ncbi:MAG: hypothetical protein ACXQTE_01340 [Methanosarcinaceae archaeon]
MSIRLTPEEAERFNELKRMNSRCRTHSQSVPQAKLDAVRCLLLKGELGQLKIAQTTRVCKLTVQRVHKELLAEGLL